MDNIPISTKKITDLSEALNIVETWFKMLSPDDRREWWEGNDDNPYSKLEALVKQQMPEYEIDVYLDHRDTDEELVSETLYTVKDRIMGRTITDFQYEEFWISEIGHERCYISAIKAE